MGKLRWYKRDPVAALEGMAVLTLEERGAYNTVLDLIYARDGKVDDDERFIAGWLRCDVRVWKRIRARLLQLGKLYAADGSLRNSRADAEVDRGLSMVASARDAGKASARKRLGANNENNDIAPTTAATAASTISTTTTTKEDSVAKATAQAAPSAPTMFGMTPAQPIYTDSTHELWNEGVAIFGQLGVADRSARSNIGRWLKTHDAADVLGAIQRARDARTGNPIAFVTGALRTPGRGPPQRQSSFQDVIRELSEGPQHEPEPTFDLDLTAEPAPGIRPRTG